MAGTASASAVAKTDVVEETCRIDDIIARSQNDTISADVQILRQKGLRLHDGFMEMGGFIVGVQVSSAFPLLAQYENVWLGQVFEDVIVQAAGFLARFGAEPASNRAHLGCRIAARDDFDYHPDRARHQRVLKSWVFAATSSTHDAARRRGPRPRHR